jgi:hypothetical protein
MHRLQYKIEKFISLEDRLSKTYNNTNYCYENNVHLMIRF